MTTRAAANRYARALFDVALKEGGDLDRLETELVWVLDLFRHHEALARVMLNPAVPAARKRAAIGELTAALGLAPPLAKLLTLLAERDRLVVLPDLVAAFLERLLDHRHVVRAEVTTTAPLSPERAHEIERRLAQVTGKTVTVSSRVDPSIIGGVVARIGGTVYDASVTHQLERMRTRLAEGA